MTRVVAYKYKTSSKEERLGDMEHVVAMGTGQ